MQHIDLGKKKKREMFEVLFFTFFYTHTHIYIQKPDLFYSIGTIVPIFTAYLGFRVIIFLPTPSSFLIFVLTHKENKLLFLTK